MKKASLPLLLFLFLTGWASGVGAYVQNRTQADALVHWSTNISLLDIFVNPSNSQGYSTSDVQAQVAASIAEWSGKSRMSFRQNSTVGTNQDNLNEIFFSSDPNIFAGGSGVVGVTQVYFKNNTGEILEADILINDNFTFSTDPKEVSYLGNVITHEMGHFLGLGHSQVTGSTMFYALSRGQSQIADDDKAGIYSIYPNGNGNKGALTGKVVGGNSLVGVFGTHVQAISLKTGHVAAANLSDVDGTFVIDGLDKNDQYFIYTSPASIVGLPTRYNNVRNDFCSSSKKYRGSFFQSCGSAGEGFPQSVKLNASQVNVGSVTIRCGLDVPVNYIQNKSTTPAVFDLQSNVISGVGNTFTGYFSGQEIAASVASPLSVSDYFRLNYSNVNWSSIASSGNLYLELKVLNQSFYSPFKAGVSVKRGSGTTNVTPHYLEEADGWLNLETVVRIPISRPYPSENDFEVSITPESMEYPQFPVGLPYTKLDYFPAGSYFEDSLYFYLVSASIVKENGSNFDLVSYKSEQVSDNVRCPDAVNTYALTNYSAKGSTSSGKKKDKGIACGTVDLQGGRGDGPGGFFIGLILSLFLCSLTSSIIKQNRAKHYSKIA